MMRYGFAEDPFAERAVETDADHQELRRVTLENLSLSMEELARKVREEECGAQGEKYRQVFGISWLMRHCEAIPDVAVPRNRIYAHYVAVCAGERIKPLNPASFGKLVRMVYPDIKTRRLGVRGQSKYHYCGMKLREESLGRRDGEGAFLKGLEPLLEKEFKREMREEPREDKAEGRSAAPAAQACAGFVFKSRHLHFPANSGGGGERRGFVLPEIEEYVGGEVDGDTKSTLASLYTSHCSALIESVRYMRLKQFLTITGTFHGSLTAPVQKLLSSEPLAKWVQKADFEMYREIVRLLSPLALQVVPGPILSSLRVLSSTLISHLTHALSMHPAHFVRAKVVPALAFSALLARLLRVNDTAHAAARFLTNPADRELMRSDWQRYIDARAIVNRELPCQEEEAVKVLDDVLHLLCGTGQEGQKTEKEEGEEGGNTLDGALNRWAEYFSSLPGRFPSVSPKLFLLCAGTVETAILREITVAGGESFGAWWVVRCWIDEWMCWISERGGFLEIQLMDQMSAGVEKATGTQGLAEDPGAALSAALCVDAGANGTLEAHTDAKNDDYIHMVFDANGST